MDSKVSGNTGSRNLSVLGSVFYDCAIDVMNNQETHFLDDLEHNCLTPRETQDKKG
jgi:hypothetical protein